MGRPGWKLVIRGLCASGLALLGQTVWLATAGPVATAPAFEASPGPAGRFFWRNRNIAAQLDAAGQISFRFPDGRELAIAFPGAKPGVKPRGESRSYPVSYYFGSSALWHSNVRWERVRYREIYPGIDLVLISSASQLEYTFEVRPGADPGRIRIRYRGARVSLDRNGNLVLRMGGGQVEQRRPVAFQGLESRSVESSYELARNEIRLRLGRYDARRALTIDPVLNFSTYLGGTAFDATYAVAADSAGNIYVAGQTSSGTIPGTAAPPRSSPDAWIAKLNSAGSQLLYVTYLGGSDTDSGMGIAVDASGNVYVTGITASPDFPTTTGAYSKQFTGTQEAFVSKLNSIGQLQYSTYLGGGSDSGFAIAVDTTGAVYVAGQTASVSFPVTTGAIQRSNGGGISDGFVSKLNAAGSALVYSTYLGGSGLDLCTGIAIDASHDVYVSGTTYSSNFPMEAPLQASLLGSASAFVAEINPAGSALVYSTYLGGSILDNGNAIAVDSTGAAYVAGSTASPDFPTTVGAVQTALAGTYNAFVSKLAPGGSSLSYSTFLGGSGVDAADGIAVDSLGQAVVGGYTSSANFPVASALQPVFQGSFDAFATVVSASGATLVFSSYMGGSGDDRGYAMASSAGGILVLGGMTASTNFPTGAAVQSSFGGDYDGFALSVLYGSGLAFYPLTPCRIADTRVGSGFSGAFGAPFLAANTTRNFPIPSSSCSVPSTAQAYSFNFGALPHAPLGFLTTWPAGLPLPEVGTLGSPTGSSVSNAALVPAGSSGAISVYANAATDLIIDINGYFGPPNLAQRSGVLPHHALPRSRHPHGSGFSGAFGAPSLAANVTRTMPMPMSACGLPETSQAYSLNIGALPLAPLGFLTVWQAGLPLPEVGTLGSASGNPVSNAAIVPAGTSGAISLYANAATNVIVDSNGYFAAPGGAVRCIFIP